MIGVVAPGPVRISSSRGSGTTRRRSISGLCFISGVMCDLSRSSSEMLRASSTVRMTRGVREGDVLTDGDVGLLVVLHHERGPLKNLKPPFGLQGAEEEVEILAGDGERQAAQAA